MAPTTSEVFISSDWHSKPDKLPDSVRQWIRLGKKFNAKLIANGDALDLIVLGTEAFKGCPAIKQLEQELDGYPLEMREGNHDPERMLREVVKIPFVRIIRGIDPRYDLDCCGIWWHIEHGYTRALDWSIIGKFSPAVAAFMVKRFPQQWYWLMKKLGALASDYDTKAVIRKSVTPGGGNRITVSSVTSNERRRYDKLVGTIHSAWVEYAEKNETNCVIGHTHKAMQMRSWKGVDSVQVLDAGNLKDGSYVRLNGLGGHIRWL